LRIRRLIVSLISALAAAALVYAVYVVLLRQVELQETVQVVVPKQFLAAGTVLTEQLLEHRNLARAGLDEQMLTSLSDAVGKQTLVPLGAGEPLLAWKLTALMLLPKAGEASFEIPREYIRSISSGIRPGDRVRIYVSSEWGRRLLAEDVVVASVKLSDSGRDGSDALGAGQEADNRRSLLALRDGRQIERINLNLTEDQWLAIDRACQGAEGGRLIIALPGGQDPLASGQSSKGWEDHERDT